MRLFHNLYNKALSWSASKFAIYWLSIISFLESSILPYPIQDIILASMSLKNKNKAYYYAFICTISSVLGGIAGYLIGYFAYDILLPFMQEMDYMYMLERARVWFDSYGIWVIAIAGFSPVPYKIFTITAGVMSMHLIPFIAMSMLSRGARYFLVSFLVKRYGDSCDKWLQKYIDRLGYALIVVVIIGIWYAQ